MTGSVDNIVCKVVLVRCHPTLQTASGIQNNLFRTSDLPSNLSYILFSLNKRNNSIYVSRVKHYLKPCLLEALEKRKSGGAKSIKIPNLITTRSPVSRLNM